MSMTAELSVNRGGDASALRGPEPAVAVTDVVFLALSSMTVSTSTIRSTYMTIKTNVRGGAVSIGGGGRGCG